MGAIKGFTYVSGPVFLKEFNLNSACTVAAFQPVTLNGAGDIIESLATIGSIAGFIQHRAIDSVPAGKCLVMVPGDRAIFSSICTAGTAASNASSGATGFQVKSGNTFFFVPSGVSSFGTSLYVVVPREDGSTLDSTDSSIWVMVNAANIRPFNQSGQPGI